jgi:hypothetical protein
MAKAIHHALVCNDAIGHDQISGPFGIFLRRRGRSREHRKHQGRYRDGGTEP